MDRFLSSWSVIHLVNLVRMQHDEIVDVGDAGASQGSCNGNVSRLDHDFLQEVGESQSGVDVREGKRLPRCVGCHVVGWVGVRLVVLVLFVVLGEGFN